MISALVCLLYNVEENFQNALVGVLFLKLSVLCNLRDCIKIEHSPTENIEDIREET
jgi:hypothetical protein